MPRIYRLDPLTWPIGWQPPKAALHAAYGKERKIGFRAIDALRNARTRIQWDEHDGYVQDDGYSPRPDAAPEDHPPGEQGVVRLRLLPDDDWGAALDFDGTERDHQRQRERAAREGVWGLQGEFWNGTAWEPCDSVWGFIGDDWKDSGYDTDIMAATIKDYEDATMSTIIDAYESRCAWPVEVYPS